MSNWFSMIFHFFIIFPMISYDFPTFSHSNNRFFFRRSGRRPVAAPKQRRDRSDRRVGKLRAMWARLEVVPMGWGYGPSPNKMGRSEGVISNTRTFVCSTGQQFFSPRAPPHFCICIYIHTYTLGYIIELVRIGGGKSSNWRTFQQAIFD